MKLKIFFVSFLTFVLSGCSSFVPKTEVKTSYWVYSIKTDKNASEVGAIVIDAVQSQVSAINAIQNIPPYPLPENPGRFQMQNMLENSNLGALMINSGISMQIPVCSNAIVTGSAVNTDMNKWGENTRINICLWQYKDGFNLDFIVQFTNTTGGFNAKAIGKAIANQIVGDSSQAIPTRINNIHERLNEAGLITTLIEKYPL